MKVAQSNSTTLALILHTLGDQAAVALADLSHDQIIAELHQTDDVRHSVDILALVDRLLRHQAHQLSDLAYIVYPAGPGAFTRLRLGACVAYGLARGHTLELLPVSSLETIACQAYEVAGPGTYIAAMDAKRRQAYVAVYELSAEGLREEVSPQLIDLDELSARVSLGWIKIGNAWGDLGLMPKILSEISLQGLTKTASKCINNDNTVGSTLLPELIYVRNDVTDN